LCGISATPPNKEIHKSALGAENSVYWEYFSSVKEAALKAQCDGYKIVLIEQTDQSIPLDQWEESTEKIALVFGNEVSGVSDEVLDVADAAVEIPQFGTKHSFNISVCAGIVLYQLFCLRAK
jgi:tRNA G18 (ribose-2'-O)-methylase SpoU